MLILSAKTPLLIFQNSIFQLHPFITPLILDQLTCSLPKNVTTFCGEENGIIHFHLSPHKMGIFGTLNLYFDQKKWIFPKSIFQLYPIITSLILDKLACSLPKTNTTFNQLFKYAKKDANFSSIRWENSRNIFGRCYLQSTLIVKWFKNVRNHES